VARLDDEFHNARSANAGSEAIRLGVPRLVQILPATALLRIKDVYRHVLDR
jgi:hypothetical protein